MYIPSSFSHHNVSRHNTCPILPSRFKNNVVTDEKLSPPLLCLSLKKKKKKKKNEKNSEAATNTWYLATKPVYTRKGERDGWAEKTSGDKSNNRWTSVRGDGERRRFLWHKKRRMQRRWNANAGGVRFRVRGLRKDLCLHPLALPVVRAKVFIDFRRCPPIFANLDGKIIIGGLLIILFSFRIFFKIG